MHEVEEDQRLYIDITSSRNERKKRYLRLKYFWWANEKMPKEGCKNCLFRKIK